MAAWEDQGCTICREQWMSGRRPRYLATNVARQAKLFLCETCDAFWQEFEREAHEITSDTAQQHFRHHD